MQDTLHLDLIRSDKDTKALADRAIATLKLAAYKAAANLADPAAHPLPADAGTFEHVLARRLAGRRAASQQKATTWATKLAASPEARTRVLGALAKVDIRSARPVAELARAVSPPTVDRAAVERFVKAGFSDKLLAAPPPAPHAQAKSSPPGKALAVRIHRVICEDETDGFLGTEAGDDEIGIGGVTVDETGDVHKIAGWTVGTEFDDGERKVYSPAKKFDAFTLAEGGNHWPKSYALSIYLSELDNGGFPGFLSDLAGQVKNYVEAYLNGWFPGLGSLVVMILDVFVGWLVSIWEDDIFPGITIQTDISSDHHVFASGTRTSGMKKYWTQAHGGKYWVWLDWQITT